MIWHCSNFTYVSKILGVGIAYWKYFPYIECIVQIIIGV